MSNGIAPEVIGGSVPNVIEVNESDDVERVMSNGIATPSHPTHPSHPTPHPTLPSQHIPSPKGREGRRKMSGWVGSKLFNHTQPWKP